MKYVNTNTLLKVYNSKNMNVIKHTKNTKKYIFFKGKQKPTKNVKYKIYILPINIPKDTLFFVKWKPYLIFTMYIYSGETQ